MMCKVLLQTGTAVISKHLEVIIDLDKFFKHDMYSEIEKCLAKLIESVVACYLSTERHNN